MGVPISPTPATAGQVYSLVGGVWTPGAAGSGDVSHVRQIIAGTGLTGGGDLSADRTLTVDTRFLNYATATLTSAEIKALSATPKTLVAAQGAGTLIELQSVVFEYLFVSQAYVNGAGGNPLFLLGTGTVALANFLTLWTEVGGNLGTALKAGSSQVAPGGQLPTLGAGAVACLNQPLLFTQGSGATRDLVTGDGTMVIKFTYRVHTGL